MKKALENIRILDLSRVLAGPYCTQMLGDMGAEILKIERPGQGDDTRYWGPPYLKDAEGNDTGESAYYLSCNRNKKSVAIDIANEKGQALIHRLLDKSDVLIENFKTGGLAKYGLSYDRLKDRYPSLIYCSITGFGQNGPLAREPGYDFLAQGMAGLMAHTGAPGDEPTKAGIAISDILTGMNAAVGILAALNARAHSGKGQYVDVALTDCTLAAMTNIAQYYLTSGRVAPRVGNAHATIVPYQVFETADGYMILAVGNNAQFAKFCALAGHPEWADDTRFLHNKNRVENREALSFLIADTLRQRPAVHWIELCQAADVPAGPINTMDKVFAMEQIQARGMEIEMPHPSSREPVHLVGSPIKLSETPVSYDLPPPVCGQHTQEVLMDILGLDEAEIEELAETEIIGICPSAA